MYNSRLKFQGNNPQKNSFEVNLSDQRKILNQMSNTMMEARAGKYKGLLPFQERIIISYNSLIQLYEYLQSKYKNE